MSWPRRAPSPARASLPATARSSSSRAPGARGVLGQRRARAPAGRCAEARLGRALERGERVLGRCARPGSRGRARRIASSPSHASREERRPAGRRLEQPAGRAPAHLRHGAPRDVERQPRRGEEGRMLGRRQMAHEVDVVASRGNPADTARPPITKRRVAAGAAPAR